MKNNVISCQNNSYRKDDLCNYKSFHEKCNLLDETIEIDQWYVSTYYTTDYLYSNQNKVYFEFAWF